MAKKKIKKSGKQKNESFWNSPSTVSALILGIFGIVLMVTGLSFTGAVIGNVRTLAGSAIGALAFVFAVLIFAVERKK